MRFHHCSWPRGEIATVRGETCGSIKDERVPQETQMKHKEIHKRDLLSQQYRQSRHQHRHACQLCRPWQRQRRIASCPRCKLWQHRHHCVCVQCRQLLRRHLIVDQRCRQWLHQHRHACQLCRPWQRQRRIASCPRCRLWQHRHHCACLQCRQL